MHESTQADKASSRHRACMRRQNSLTYAEIAADRPWHLHEALSWWVVVVFSLSSITWSAYDGLVLNRRIERVHDAGTVVSAQQGREDMHGSAVTTSRLVVPLLQTATLLVGEPMTLQQRASGRYYLCDRHRRCLRVRGKEVSASLTEWTTPQALGMGDQDEKDDMPADDVVALVMCTIMLLAVLGLTGWLRPFGPGRVPQRP